MINKYPMVLLTIILVVGGFFGIRQIPKNSIAYRSVEKSDCGMHYDVTTPSLDVYHVSAESIDWKNKRIRIYKPGRKFLIAVLFTFYSIYVFFQIRVWICKPDDFCTGFFYKWSDACHRPPSEEFCKSFRTFLGLE